MKIVNKFLAAVVLLTTVSACNLDYNPSYALIYTEYDQLFDTYDEAGSYYNSMNYALRAVQQGTYWQTSDFQGDMFNITSGAGNTMGTIHTMDDGFTSLDDYTATIWNGNNSVVNYANYFIANIKNVDLVNSGMTDSEISNFNKFCGTAYFLRAYAFYNSALYFAPAYTMCDPSTTLAIPMMLEPDVLAQPARETLEDVYTQIYSDIKTAEAYLADHGAKSSGGYYVTLDAVYALAAQVNLSAGNYMQALTYCETLINSGIYTLASSVAALEEEFISQTNCQETILMSYVSKTESSNTNSYYYGNYQGYTEDQLSIVYAPYFLPTATLYNSYSGTDTRKGVFFKSEVMKPTSEEVTATFFAKYRGNPDLTSNTYNSSVTMPRIFAISEIYLIAAEAMYMYSGDESLAVGYLNTLQKARGATLTTGSIENIKTEWAKETVGEGKRIQCLKRWGDGFSGRVPLNESLVLTGTYYTERSIEATDYHLVWPVSSDEIQTNPNLIQNPGW